MEKPNFIILEDSLQLLFLVIDKCHIVFPWAIAKLNLKIIWSSKGKQQDKRGEIFFTKNPVFCKVLYKEKPKINVLYRF